MEKNRNTRKLFTRNFTLLILGQISSLFGNYSLKFALSMYVLEQTGEASVFAGMLALAMVPAILCSPFGGILADRVSRRNIMVALDTFSGLAVLLTGAAFPFGNEIFLSGLLLFVLSILGAFESPTVQACVPQMLSGENLLKGNGIVSQVQAVAGLVTPFLGSVLYTTFGIRLIFCGAALCFVTTACLECCIRLETQKPGRKMGLWEMVKEDFQTSLRFLCREQTDVLYLLLLAAVVSMFVVGIVSVGVPYLIRTTLGLSPEHYGAAESLAGVAAVLGSLAAGLLGKKIGVRQFPLLIEAVGLLILPAGIGFLLPAGSLGKYGILVAAVCGCQFVCSMFSIYALSAIQERTPEGMTGKVMACVYTLSMCAQPLGQILYGILFDAFAAQVYWVLIPSGILIWVIGSAAGKRES